jgi:CBS domain containing-hemolysin-like protein
MDSSASTLFNLFVIAFLLFANGFFVASEFSMVKVRRTRIEELTKQGDSNAKIALEALKDLDKFIAAVQLGVTISSIGLGWVGEATLARMIEPLFNFLPHTAQTVATHTLAVSIAFAIITVLHVVIGELIPKSIALQFTEKTSLIIARPMRIITTIFLPFIWILNGLGNFILSLLKIPHPDQSLLVHSTEELDMLVDASFQEGVLNETEKEILHNAFKFSDLTAKQVMVPRTDIVGLPKNISFEDLKEITCENQYTRYPIYDEDIDSIIGLLHVKDVYSCNIKNEVFDIERLMRPILCVPEMITMDNIVMEFKKCNAQMAVVVDEFGGTAGIITLEDVFEEIFGEVQDEFDDEEEEAEIKEIEENTYLADAMVRLDEMAEFFNEDEKDYSEEDVDTLGGLVLKVLGRIANVDDSVEWNDLTLKVQEVDGVRITKIVIIKNIPSEETEKTEA